jgi:hypothetical protein
MQMGEVKGHDQIDVKTSFKEPGHKPERIIAPRNRIRGNGQAGLADGWMCQAG